MTPVAQDSLQRQQRAAAMLASITVCRLIRLTLEYRVSAGILTWNRECTHAQDAPITDLAVILVPFGNQANADW